MAIEELLKNNREFVASGGFDKPSLSADGPLLLVAPSSPLLVAGLEQAFGLRPGEAVVIQLPAVWSGGEDRALLRAAALAIHMHGCREVLVAGLDGDPLCPPARGAVRQAVQAAGLSPGSPELEQLQDTGAHHGTSGRLGRGRGRRLRPRLGWGGCGRHHGPRGAGRASGRTGPWRGPARRGPGLGPCLDPCL
ncbi:MAG TPA: hypothetical protein P5076_22240, partial [Myxococcota bacterium]|nr:hypothetical protein [Myxococcota bacterium]